MYEFSCQLFHTESTAIQALTKRKNILANFLFDIHFELFSAYCVLSSVYYVRVSVT